ncbi:TetR/AcrR family transcriptional regulator [Paraburkholderia sp. Se-20369]|nr:TetR/AcrR family transcriptional regulator [Paraburkholderia sp. Se-20369]
MNRHLDMAPHGAPVQTDSVGVAATPAAEQAAPRVTMALAGVRRKKAPEQVRAGLLVAASEIVTERGVQALTLEAVAARAGVTKGALQYHFENKQGLLDVLFEQTTTRFVEKMEERIAADPQPAGAAARAYVHTAIDQTNPAASMDLLRALVASMVSEPETRKRWAVPIREWTRPDPVPLEQAAKLMICRLAADGLWFADILGCQDMPDDLHAEIVRQLERMTIEAGSAGPGA